MERSLVTGRSRLLMFGGAGTELAAGITLGLIGQSTAVTRSTGDALQTAAGFGIILAAIDIGAYVLERQAFDPTVRSARLLGPVDVSWNGRSRPLAVEDVYRNGVVAEKFSARELLARSAPPAVAGRVAVLEFENQVPASEGTAIDRVYFSDQVRGALSVAMPGTTIMTRENTIQLLAASGKRLEDCVGECEVDTGRLLGADYVVSGRLTKVGTRFKLTLRLHATAQGTLVATSTASGETLNQLDDDTPNAVRTLIAGLSR